MSLIKKSQPRGPKKKESRKKRREQKMDKGEIEKCEQNCKEEGK